MELYRWICYIVAVLLVIHLVLAEQKLIHSQTFSNDHLSKLQFYNESIYAVSHKRLYKLDRDLKIINSTGTCADNVAVCDNVNQIMLVNEATEELILCGTGNDGKCEIRSLGNISMTHAVSDTLKVSTDRKRPAHAFIMPDGNMMIGVTYGSGLEEVDSIVVQSSAAISYNYLISTRSLLDTNLDALKRLILGIYKKQVASLEDYKIYVKGGFQHNGFSYFTTIQKNFVGDEIYVSKLVRICQNDTSGDYKSYADINIICQKDGVVYNLIQHVVIVDQPDNKGTLFIASFSAGDDPESTPGDSAICVTQLADLDEAIMAAKKEFIVCPKSNRNISERYLPNQLPYAEGCLANKSLYKEVDVTCDTAISTFTYVIGETPFNMAAVYTSEYNITTLYGEIVDGNKVDIHAGTSNGHILKFNYFDPKTMLELYETMYIPPGFDVIQINQSADNYYVLTTRTLSKYNNTNCLEYTTCAKTMTGRNPRCGWCVYKQSGTQKSNCSSDLNHWLSSHDGCINLSLDVKRQPINSTGKQVQLTVNRFPSEQNGDEYKCIYKNGATSIGITTASRNNNYINCSSPTVDSHTKATLELWVNDVLLASSPFWFYDCRHYNRCGECTNTTESDCQWCLPNQCVPSGQCSRGVVSKKKQCPQLEENPSKFVPSGVLTSVEFRAKNLNDTLDYFLTIPGIQSIKAVKAQNTTQKSVTFEIQTTSDEQSESYPVTIKYGPHGKGEESRVELDDSFKNKVTVYMCSKMASDCTRCNALNKTRYNCKWCDEVPAACNHNESGCTSTTTCPAPVVTKIVPKDGPIQGYTRVTISGTDLGSSLSNISSVTLAGTACSVTGVVPDPDSQDFDTQVTKEIQCTSEKQSTMSAVGVPGDVIVTAAGKRSRESDSVTFTYQNVTITGLHPDKGPIKGGTRVTIYGENLGVGNREFHVWLGISKVNNTEVLPKKAESATVTSVNFTVQFVVPSGLIRNVTEVKLYLPNYAIFPVAVKLLNYTLLPDPVFDSIPNKKAIKSGGNLIKVTGQRLTNGNVGFVKTHYAGQTSPKSMCVINNPTLMTCPTPRATKNMEIQSEVNKSRKKRSPDCGCWETTVSIHLDGIVAEFIMVYYSDPTLNPIGEKRLFESEDQILTITGTNLNTVFTKDEINVTIGIKMCAVIKLTESQFTCLAPKTQPTSGMGQTLPEVNVTLGNIHETLGFLEYTMITSLLVIIAASIGGGVIVIFLIGALVFWKKYKKMGKRARDFEKSLNEMELEIKSVAREEFLDMHNSMSGVNKNLVEQGFPYHDYQQYAFYVMFPMEFMDSHPLLHDPVVNDETRIKMKKGMEALELLISNKFFLISVILTMEKQKKFFLKEKSNMAGNLCGILLGRMDYLNEILGSLLTNLVQESVGKRSQKTLFRRCESITEKLLSNWLSLCLYPHIKANSGSPLYLLFKATQFTMESGPIDVITDDTKYTLSEEKLLKKWSSATEDGSKDPKLEAKVLTLNVVVDNGEEIYKCKVLDCDTITQVKEKCINQIYVNFPASHLKVEADDLNLEWHSGFSGSLNLKDEDNTNKREGGLIRLNTLAHYNVQDESNMALIDPNCADFNQQEDYVNLAQVQLDTNQSCNGSMDSTEPLTSSHDVENALPLQQWHLVKPEDEMHKSQKSAIDELYLNRLFTTKQSILEYMCPLFDILLDSNRCPPPIKHLFDLLDDLSDNNKVDADTLYKWKSHSYAIRVWASLMKKPAMLFDVRVPSYVDTSMDVISQVFIDTFSLSMQKFTKDSAPHKLIFKKEMLQYQAKVAEFYKNVKVSTAKPEVLRQYLIDANKLQQQLTNFNRMSALYRFYQQMEPYMDDIVDDLSMNKEASSLQLDKKLESIIQTMEEEA